jgi:hypothetical protein
MLKLLYMPLIYIPKSGSLYPLPTQPLWTSHRLANSNTIFILISHLTSNLFITSLLSSQSYLKSTTIHITYHAKVNLPVTTYAFFSILFVIITLQVLIIFGTEAHLQWLPSLIHSPLLEQLKLPVGICLNWKSQW